MSFGLTPVDLVVIFAALIVGAALQGAVGYGMGLIASPLLVLVNPDLIPGPFIVAALFLILAMILREREGLDFLGLRWAVAGMVPGTIAGSLLLAALDTRIMVPLFAVFVLLAVAMSAAGARLKPRRPTLLTAGTVSGLMGVISTLSGPPIALVYQNVSGPQLRATLAGYFLCSTVVSITSLTLVGEFGWRELGLSLILVPGIVIGFLISSHITPLVDRGYTRPAVLTVAGLAAISIIVRTIV